MMPEMVVTVPESKGTMDDNGENCKASFTLKVLTVEDLDAGGAWAPGLMPGLMDTGVDTGDWLGILPF